MVQRKMHSPLPFLRNATHHSFPKSALSFLQALCYPTFSCQSLTSIFCVSYIILKKQNSLKFSDTLSILMSPSPVHCLSSLRQSEYITPRKPFCPLALGSSLAELCLLCTFRTPWRPALLHLPPRTYHRNYLLYVPMFSKRMYSLNSKTPLIRLSIFNSPFYLCTGTKYV